MNTFTITTDSKQREGAELGFERDVKNEKKQDRTKNIYRPWKMI